MSARESEFRMAITQTLGCQGGRLIEVVEVGARAVHVFVLHGHKSAERCYVWTHRHDSATLLFHVVPQSARIQDAEQAVRSVALPRRRGSAI